MTSETERKPKYKIAWLPGEGIGVDVLDRPDRARQAAAGRRIPAWGYRVGVLVQGGGCFPWRAPSSC